MANSSDQLYVDKDGIPHWDGEDLALLRQYRLRVGIEYETWSGDSDLAADKRASLGLRLTRGLTGRAWTVVEPLLVNMSDLKVDTGHRLILKALESLDKEEVVRKQMKFDEFFKKSFRKRGTDMATYLRDFRRKYSELRELDDNTQLSDDLYAYFLLEGARLSDDQQRLVCMVADNEYETRSFEKTLKTNFHDVHTSERQGDGPRKFGFGGAPKGKDSKGKGKGKDRNKGYYQEEAEDQEDEAYYTDGDDNEEAEAEQVSDVGASEDEEIYEAYTAYDKARQKVKTLQTQRGFFKAEGTMTFEEKQERKDAIQKEKKRTACGACGRIGHWAGDAECPKSTGKGKQGKGKSTGVKGRATTRNAAYFTLDDSSFGVESAYATVDEDFHDARSEITEQKKDKTDKPLC